jgi:hypothetical protein
VTEQKTSNCLSDATTDMEDVLVTLYSTLVDEDNFLLEDNTLAPKDDFLKNVEEKIVERGEISSEKLKLSNVKNKIRIKERQLSCERRNSVSSIRSISSKIGSSELAGGEQKSRKTIWDSTLYFSQSQQ